MLSVEVLDFVIVY